MLRLIRRTDPDSSLHRPRKQLATKSPAAGRIPRQVRTGTKSRIFVLILGAGVTPAEGSMKPTAGFIKIKSFHPSGRELG